MQVESASSLYLQSPRLNQLNVLREIAADPNTKQAAVARRCHLSVAMVNNYMKELASLGLLEYRRKSSKTMTYHLTSLGGERLEELELELIQEMARMFSAAQDKIRDHILRQAGAQIRRAVLVGTDYLARLAFHALEAAGAIILGVCDKDDRKISCEFCGRQVLSLSQIRFMAPDVVVVTESNEPEELLRILGYLSDRGARVVRLTGKCRQGLVHYLDSMPQLATAKEQMGAPAIDPKTDS